MPDIAIAAKRYDNGNGAATFTGCIPLKRGQLFETNTGVGSGTPLVAGASLRGNISLWNAAGTVEQRCLITALYPQHSDGSIKVVMVSTVQTLASGVQLDLILRLGTSPATAVQPTAHPTINAAWMKFPLLIGCTDSTHMCQARVAFGPLVPVNDPRLPVNWQAMLTTELENGYTEGTGDLNLAGFPTLKLHLQRLAALGDMGTKLCLVTAGSNVVTILDSGWPTPTSAPTDQLTVGMQVTNTLTPFNTTIQSIQPPNQVTLNAAAPAGFATRPVDVTFGPRLQYRDANYNLLAVFFYRYLTAASGHLDKLRTALLASVTRGIDVLGWIGKGTPTTIETAIGVANFGTGPTVRYKSSYTDGQGVVHPANENFVFDEYGQPWNGSPQGSREDLSGFHQGAYMCYVLSGWQQALGTCLAWGMHQMVSNTSFAAFPGHPWQPDSVLLPAQLGGTSGFHSPSQQGFSGARLSFRLRREVEAFLYMLSMPMDLIGSGFADGTGHCAPSPRVAANKTKWLDYFQRKYYDSVELWSNEFGPGAPLTNYLDSKWGFSIWYGDSPNHGETALFQLQMAFNVLAMVYMNIKEDARFLTEMGELAVWIAEQETKRLPTPSPLMNPNAVARADNPPIWFLPYGATDPALLENPEPANNFYGVNTYTTGILLAFLIWAYRVTGNTKLLQMADAHCTIYAWTGNPQSTANNGAAYEWSVKGCGEKFHMAFYAAAWRAGETWGTVSEFTAPGEPIVAAVGQGIEDDVTPVLTVQGGHIVADFTFNVAKSRVRFYHDSVKDGSPSTARLIWVALNITGLEADAALKDHNTLAALLAGSSNEVTNTGYARIVVAAASLTTSAENDTDDWIDLDIADPSWAAVNAGDNWGKLVLCYAPDSTGADSTFVPMKAYDFSVTPNGSAVSATIPSTGYHRTRDAA
ncbi:MAG TPA: hypothetical protein VJ816_04785 [Gemmatimonadales bacterium]|nr:hypothetical protein [Gemmatimonadales bacterium]